MPDYEPSWRNLLPPSCSGCGLRKGSGHLGWCRVGLKEDEERRAAQTPKVFGQVPLASDTGAGRLYITASTTGACPPEGCRECDTRKECGYVPTYFSPATPEQ